jgi:methylthioribose-1-phosphate isomerase
MHTGDNIPIEERSPDEVRAPYGYSIVPDHYRVRNPAFDVTPQKYLSGMITECGIILPPFKEKLAKLMKKR